MRTLDSFAPDLISVEISPFSVYYRTRHMTKWLRRFREVVSELPARKQRHGRLRLLRRQLLLPYEWTAARDFAEDHGIRALAIDSGRLARLELSEWENGLLSRENLTALADSPDINIEEHFITCRKHALSLIEQPNRHHPSIHPLSWLEEPEWAERERLLARRLMRLLKIRRRVVHIGGWMHLVAGSPWKTVNDYLARAGINVKRDTSCLKARNIQ